MQRADRENRDSLAAFREYMSLEQRRAKGLSPAELERWTNLRKSLDRDFGDLERTDSLQRRATPRVPTSLEVRFETIGQLGSVLMKNMSRGGIFVATETPPPIGTELKLRIQVGAPPREIVLCGEVASWNVSPVSRSGSGEWESASRT